MKKRIFLGAAIFCTALYATISFSFNAKTNSLQDLRASAGGSCTVEPCSVCTDWNNPGGDPKYGKTWTETKPGSNQ